jgi:hypothetical protein
MIINFKRRRAFNFAIIAVIFIKITKMKSPAALILLLTTTCIIYSCSKDGESPNEGTELLQVKYNYHDGTSTKRRFDRNASDKLVSFRDSSSVGWREDVALEYGTDGRMSRANFLDLQGNILFYYEFEYDSNGRLRKKQARPGTINLADDYHMYAYDNAGHLVADSVFVRSGGPITFLLSNVTKFIYTGDNVTESEHYRYLTGNGLEQRRKFEYDNGINPFKNLDNYYSITEGSNAIEQIRYVSHNNMVAEYTADANAPYQLMQTFKYKYNSSGYPWKQILEVNNFGPWITDAEFFYKQ